MTEPGLHNMILLGALLIPVMELLNGLCMLVLPRKTTSFLTVFTSVLAIGTGVVLLAAFPSADTALQQEISWFALGKTALSIGVYLDNVSLTLLLLLYGIALLVKLFSLSYMKGDLGLKRYWFFLSFFIVAMSVLILSPNLFQAFVGWEMVGLFSYLLIGFWHGKEAVGRAAQKALLLNKIGDIAFLAAVLLLIAQGSGLSWNLILAGSAPAYSAMIGVLLFIACAAKSAQFPLQVWLPDAMAGPTPISALIHAATMVAAGVFLLIRIFPVLLQPVLTLILCVGALTTFLAALSALAQSDIKKLLAYSTISQLGYMVAAIGLGTPAYAFFHLLTHAGFKAGLFLLAGVLILGMKKKGFYGAEAQNLREIRKANVSDKLLFLFATIYLASLTGLPFFSGFLSKEGILTVAYGKAVSTGSLAVIFSAVILWATVAITAAYSIKLLFYLLPSNSKFKISLSWKVTVPLLVLAVASLAIPYAPLNIFSVDPESFFPMKNLGTNHGELPFAWLFSLLIGLFAGIFTWKALKKQKENPAHLLFTHFGIAAFYEKKIAPVFLSLANAFSFVDNKAIDRVVDTTASLVVDEKKKHSLSSTSKWVEINLIDKLVNGIAKGIAQAGKRLRQIQSGDIQRYLIYSLIVTGIILLIVWALTM